MYKSKLSSSNLKKSNLVQCAFVYRSIHAVIPEPMRPKAEQQMNQLLKQANKKKIQMNVIAADDVEIEIEWTANVLFNSLKLPSGVIIITNKLSHV